MKLAGRTLALLLAATAIGAAVFQLVNTAPPIRRQDLPPGERTILLSPVLFVEAPEISRGNAAPLCEQGPHRFIETCFAVRHRPVSCTLIEENRAEANQPGVDDFIDGARRRGLFFMYDRTIEASLEQRAQSGMTKVPGEVALFGRHRMVAASNSRTPGVIIARRSDRRVSPGKTTASGSLPSTALMSSMRILAPCQLRSIGGFRHVRFRAEQMGGFDYRALERQVLESV